MKPFPTIVTVTLLFCTICTFAQRKNVDSLICKDWTVIYAEQLGMRFPVDAGNEGHYIFAKDHKVTILQGTLVQNGNWKYLTKDDLIEINFANDTEPQKLKVVSLDAKVFEAEYQDPANPNITFHMESK